MLMKKFSIEQRNNLKIGNTLSAELPSTSHELRCFISVGAYVKSNIGSGGSKISKILNRCQNVLFCMRKYEINKKYIENEWDISEEILINSIYKGEISSIDL